MGVVEFVALLLASIGPLLALSHVLRLPATIILLGAGSAPASASACCSAPPRCG